MTGEMPDKILRIEDLTFVLSDDFCGDFVNALEEMLAYMKRNKHNKLELNDNNSTIQSLLSANNGSRICMKYGVFVKVDDKTYRLQMNNAITDDK